MNKNTKKRYQEISKPILSGAVFIASVGLIGAGALAASSSLYNLKAANPANNNQLTAENRDTLVTEVENLKNQITRNTQSKGIRENEGTPSGAVIAFDSESCPEGWTRFANADGRFIMGTEPGRAPRYPRESQPIRRVGLKGGKDSIKLTIDELPPHKFHLFADEVGKDRGFDRNWAQNEEHKNRSIIWENDHDDGDDNFSYTLAVSASNRAPSVGVTNTLGNGNSIDITNPYIKLLYCKKN